MMDRFPAHVASAHPVQPDLLVHHLSRADTLCRRLGCDERAALTLLVSPLPRPERWRQDVAALAARTGVSPAALGTLLADVAGEHAMRANAPARLAS